MNDYVRAAGETNRGGFDTPFQYTNIIISKQQIL